ncbi:hypothetical protein KEJ45_05670 [Candidatus Bathyarchaeota archaeon]|nr:hypothetical protein [Candidatus Bathyarchaeota archaeon]
MLETKLSPIATIAIIFVSAMFGLYRIPLSNAAESTVNANPRIIYWPAPQVWQTEYGHIMWNSGGIDATSIAWSPSGEILFIAGSDRFVVINASTWSPISDSCNLWGYSGQGVFDSFVISPNDSKIFYVNTSYVFAPSSAIYSMSLGGSDPTFITYVNSCSSCVPTFFDLSSDGMTLLYTEFAENYSTYPYTRFSRIWKVNLETSERSLILELEGPDNQIFSVRFSPSDDKIAFSTYTGVWIINSDGTHLTRIADILENSIAMHLNWAPNGTMLTYTEVDYGGRSDYHPYNIWWPNSNITAINVDGSNKHTIFYGAACWTWSPLNGSIAAFIKIIGRGVPYLIDLSLPISSDPDSDGDGLSDREEIFCGYFNPLDPTDLYKDYDNDGLSNLEEYEFNIKRSGVGTYPLNLLNPDTDGDGLSDGVEIKVFRTDPTRRDTDGDGIDDGLEAAATGLSAFVSVLPEGWIRMTLQWSNKTMYVSTNSSVLGVVFNSTSMVLSISVGGPDGTTGIANITIPMEMITSLSAVSVTLDNQPIEFQINQVGSYAQIYVEYHHSFHELTAHLSSSGVGIGGVDLTGIMSYWWLMLSITIVAVASIIALIIVKRR